MRAFVLHWDPPTLAEKGLAVRDAGADVVGAEATDGRRVYDEVRKLAPDVLVIWLAWKPSHGRVAAAAIRSASWGRKLPILFVDDPAAPAPPATLQRIKAAVPDAIVDRPDRLAFWFGRIAPPAP
ncbi:MAG: hypothetical protein AABY18_10270 [Candidatus Thermoplasmatota archaeon]